MVQSQLDDSTEFGDLLELQEQIRALQTELAEVKQADDEELDKLLDQNGNTERFHMLLHTMSSVAMLSSPCQVLQALLFHNIVDVQP